MISSVLEYWDLRGPRRIRIEVSYQRAQNSEIANILGDLDERFVPKSANLGGMVLLGPQFLLLHWWWCQKFIILGPGDQYSGVWSGSYLSTILGLGVPYDMGIQFSYDKHSKMPISLLSLFPVYNFVSYMHPNNFHDLGEMSWDH
jgi:hypothetical protein